MNKYIILAAVTIGLISMSFIAGVQHNEAAHAKQVAALNKTIYDLGVVVQTETNAQAELNRQVKVANRDRINAIKTNDHANKAVRELQTTLDKSVSELETLRTDYNYIVLDVVSVVRVYDDARRQCRGLTDSNDSPVVSAQLSEFTGDSITTVVKYLTGRYCEVATDYNALYLDAEKLLAQ